MDVTGLLPLLSLGTLVLVLVLLIGLFVHFLRSRRNREAAARVHGLDDTQPRK